MLKNKKIGLGITGSFCNLSKVKPEIDMLKSEGVEQIIPIVSYSILTETNRFGKPDDIITLLREETGEEIVDSISKAETIGPQGLVDIIVVAPCTGNTIAKLACGITDTPVLMAIKGHIRNNKPVVLGVATNDGMGANGENILKLLNTKNSEKVLSSKQPSTPRITISSIVLFLKKASDLIPLMHLGITTLFAIPRYFTNISPSHSKSSIGALSP